MAEPSWHKINDIQKTEARAYIKVGTYNRDEADGGVEMQRNECSAVQHTAPFPKTDRG